LKKVQIRQHSAVVGEIMGWISNMR